MAAPLTSSQSSLASQLLQKASQSVPSSCGSGLARDGSPAGFMAKLAGKPAPTERHRNLPIPLWERARPRWQRHWFQDRARWQASSYRKASQSAPSSCGSGLARDDDAADFKAELAGKPAPTEKQHRNLPAPTVGAGLPAMAAPLTSGRARWQASSYREASQPAPSPCGSGLARDGSAAVFKAELAGKPAPTEKHRNLPPPPVGAGLPAMAAPLSSRPSSLASQLLQISIAA